MTSDDFERFIEKAAPDYNAPPEPPREEMWAAIRERLPRAERRREAPALDIGERRAAREGRRRRMRRWTPWAIGIATAATLAVGFGLGRLTTDAVPGDRGPATVAGGGASEERVPSRSVRLAAAHHLGEAEALLTFYRTAQQEGDRVATAHWARELLSTTRLMLDARAGQDPALAQLLGDLELVLVQIVAAGAEPEDDRELIEDSMEQRQLLAKLRTASSGTPQLAM